MIKIYYFGNFVIFIISTKKYFSKRWNSVIKCCTKFRYNYIKDPEYLPEYLIIILEREKYSTDNTPMLIPKIELDNEYILVAYLNRKIEDGYEIFNSVYSIRQSNNLTWMLSEGDTIKKLETNELKNTYGTPEILFYEIKKK